MRGTRGDKRKKKGRMVGVLLFFVLFWDWSVFSLVCVRFPRVWGFVRACSACVATRDDSHQRRGQKKREGTACAEKSPQKGLPFFLRLPFFFCSSPFFPARGPVLLRLVCASVCVSVLSPFFSSLSFFFLAGAQHQPSTFRRRLACVCARAPKPTKSQSEREREIAGTRGAKQRRRCKGSTARQRTKGKTREKESREEGHPPPRSNLWKTMLWHCPQTRRPMTRTADGTMRWRHRRPRDEVLRASAAAPSSVSAQQALPMLQA